MIRHSARRLASGFLASGLLAGTSIDAFAQISMGQLVAGTPLQPEAPVLDTRARLEVSNVLLDDALKALQLRSGVSIIYSPSRLPRLVVSCSCLTLSVAEALDRLLINSRLLYTVYGEHIVIEPHRTSALEGIVEPQVVTATSTSAEGSMLQTLIRSGRGLVTAGALAAATLSGPGEASAQSHAVSGRVTSEDLAPLIGVNVGVKGTTIGTITNASGSFTLQARTPNDTLVFSILGMRTEEVGIAGRSTVNVVLQQDAVALEGIVVVGYGTQTRATVSGSVSAISSEDIERTSATTGAEALVGKIQGINTRIMTGGTGTSGGRAATGADGRPGAATAIQIRNMGAPLFVIDGVPSDESAFQHLNSSDIETISVLKDASASVYGFRAANGVILVTTKRGRAQAPQLRIDGYYGVQNLTRLPYEHMTTAYEYKASDVESQQNLGQNRTIPTQEALNDWRSFPSYDAADAIINNPNAAQYNFNASLSGTAGDANYYLSFGHVSQDYVMKDNNFNRSNIQANLSALLFDKLTLDAKLRGRQELTSQFALAGNNDVVRTAILGINSTWPFQSPFADPNGQYIAYDQRYLARTPPSYNKEKSGWQDDTVWDLNATFFAEYELPLNSSIRASYSQTRNFRNFDQHRYSFDAYRYNEATETYEVAGRSGESARFQSRRRGESDWLQFLFNTQQVFDAHSITATLGYERDGGENWTTEVTSVPPGNFTHIINFADLTDLGNSWGINRRESYIGRVNYDFEQKYLVELLGRYDGSHLFADGNRWGFFPGVSVGWRITEEDFFSDRVGFFDELKLRASWGEAGREQIGAWQYLGGATYNSGTPSFLDGALIPGIGPRGIPVTNLSWVTSTNRNLGVDFQMLDSRLSGEFDVFERKLDGLPASRYDVLIPTETGYTLPQENLESEATQGLEGIIRWSDQFRGVSYSIAPHATLARNKVLDRYKPRYGNSWDRYRNASEHRWVGTTGAFGYESAGQFQTMEEIERYPVNIDGQGNRTLLPGDLKYVDQNNDGIINSMDQRVLGYPTSGTPLISYGLNGSFSYGSVSLSYDFAGGALFSFLAGNEMRYPYFGDHNSQTFHNDRWRRADLYDDQSEWIPGRFPPLRKGVLNHSSRQPVSDFWRTNVRYLRLKRLELGYSVPADLSDRIGMSRMRVYTSATNPLLFDNLGYMNLDPEIVQGNGLNYPSSRVINVGFSATVGGTPSEPAPVIPVPPAD